MRQYGFPSRLPRSYPRAEVPYRHRMDRSLKARRELGCGRLPEDQLQRQPHVIALTTGVVTGVRFLFVMLISLLTDLSGAVAAAGHIGTQGSLRKAYRKSWVNTSRCRLPSAANCTNLRGSPDGGRKQLCLAEEEPVAVEEL